MKTPHPLAADPLLNGYQILDVLRPHPQGAVMLALEADAGNRVVIQELRSALPDARRRAQAEERLQAELAVLRRIDHPAFARVLDVFHWEGAWMVVREFVAGTTLQEIHDRAGTGLDASVVLDWARDLCESLAWLHALEPPVFFRAVQPDHLVVTPDGALRWISYGLRSVLAPRHPHTGVYVRGDEASPYAAFEQQGGTGTYQARSEVYAVGALLYHLLTGQVAPDPDGRVFGGAPLRAPSELREGIAPSTDAALLRALAMEPAERQPNMRVLLRALRPDLVDESATAILDRPVVEATVELSCSPPEPTAERSAIGMAEGTVEAEPAPAELEPARAEVEPAEKQEEAAPAGPPSPVRAAAPPAASEFADSTTPTVRLPRRREPIAMDTRYARGSGRAPARWAQSSLPVQMPPELAVPRLRVSPAELVLGVVRPRDVKREWIFVENQGGGTLEGTVEVPPGSPLRIEPRRFQCNDLRLELVLSGSACQAADQEVAAAFTVRSNGGEAEVRVTFRALELRLDETVLIPEGTLVMGSDEDGINERPQHSVFVAAFRIDRTPVTNGQFERFVRAAGYAPEGPWRSYFQAGADLHPVVGVTWNDAMAYAKWLGGRLPTEAEWEKAARGSDRRRWPWGDLWDTSRLNCIEASAGQTTPVDLYLAGASPYGVLDMVGNVSEWTMDAETNYPYRPKRESGPRILRGGSFQDPIRACRCSSRVASEPGQAAPHRGFRTVRPA